MSTRAIREVIEHIQALSEVDAKNGDARGIMARSALREVEAIEKAAKVLDDSWSGKNPHRGTLSDAAQAVRAIAKDTK